MHIISVMKIALAHDDFVQEGGAENLFATIASLWPGAPIYTSLIDWHKLPATISRQRVRPSFLQRIPLATKFYKVLLPLYPLAFESFDFSNYDLVISSTTRFAKSVITKPGTVHICYINNVPRFLWHDAVQKEYLPRLILFLIKPALRWLKRWDRAVAARVDHYIANSGNVQSQVKACYSRSSQVIYPFADLDFFKVAKIHKWHLASQNYFLIVSRLVKWKKIDIAIEAAKILGINLKIVGSGPDEARLKQFTVHSSQSTDSTIEFLGRVTKEKLRDLYRNAQALIVTQEEDFGIAAVEAQACGTCVIAYKNSGVREIIIDGQTGLLFEKQNAASLQDAIDTALRVKWSVLACRKNALRFLKNYFVEKLKRVINDQISQRP